MTIQRTSAADFPLPSEPILADQLSNKLAATSHRDPADARQPSAIVEMYIEWRHLCGASHGVSDEVCDRLSARMSALARQIFDTPAGDLKDLAAKMVASGAFDFGKEPHPFSKEVERFLDEEIGTDFDPIMGLFQDWRALRQEGQRTETDEELDQVVDRLSAVEDQIFALPSRNARDLAIKNRINEDPSDWEKEQPLWREIRQLIGEV